MIKPRRCKRQPQQESKRKPEAKQRSEQRSIDQASTHRGVFQRLSSAATAEKRSDEANVGWSDLLEVTVHDPPALQETLQPWTDFFEAVSEIERNRAIPTWNGWGTYLQSSPFPCATKSHRFLKQLRPNTLRTRQGADE